MNFVSKQEAQDWCRAHHIALDEQGLPERRDSDLRFRIPPDAQRRVFLVGQAMKLFAEEPLFLVWFDDWSVWPSGQRMHVFDRLRSSYGETRRLIESPGHVFDRAEVEDAISFVTVSTLFLWDCYVVGPNSDKLLYLSHDEHGRIRGFGRQQEAEWVSTAARLRG